MRVSVVGFHPKYFLPAERLPAGSFHPVSAGSPAVLPDCREGGLSAVASDSVRAGGQGAMLRSSDTTVQVLREEEVLIRNIIFTFITAQCPDKSVRASLSRIVVRR